MTKKQKKFIKDYLLVGVFAFLFVGVMVANANLSFMDRIADKAGEVLGLSLSDKIQIDEPEVELGGTGGTFQTDWYKIGNRVTWIKSGQFTDASTTLLSFLNPVDYGRATSTDARYNALTHEISTSTVMNLNLDITGVSTSTGTIICGGATDAYSTPTYELFNLTLPTSTLGVFSNGLATTTGGFNAIGAGSATQILLTHEYDYFNCVVTAGAVDSDYWTGTAVKGYTGDDNTFDGYWSVEIQKNLQ